MLSGTTEDCHGDDENAAPPCRSSCGRKLPSLRNGKAAETSGGSSRQDASSAPVVCSGEAEAEAGGSPETLRRLAERREAPPTGTSRSVPPWVQ
nr:unnamed protein product [Digitaria exilis]